MGLATPGILASGIVAAAQRYSAATAAVSPDGRRLSYAELLAGGERVRGQLLAAGCRSDEPVHVLVDNGPTDLVALLGVWLAGAVAVPVRHDSPAEVQAGLLRRTGARLVLDSHLPEPVTAVATAAPPDRPLLTGAALIVFTSGSTGVPKGVVMGHEEFDGKLRQIDSLLGYRKGETSLLVLSIVFSFGMWCTLLTLRSGGRLVMHPAFAAGDFIDTLISERVARVGMVPTLMRVLFADPALAARLDTLNAQRTLRQIMIGGEPLGISLAAAVRDRLHATALIDIYGLTETATCDFFGFDADAAAYPGAIGRPSPGVEFRIAGPAADGIGELQIRSPFLMRGYLDDVELTAAAYDDGWLRTGDLGKEVGPGVVSLIGRRKELISRGGIKMAPAEIEQVISEHRDVAAAMAVGAPDEVLGERIGVLLVPRTGAHLDVSAVARHAAARLERSKRPDAYYLAAALPLGRTGKADRAAFAAMVRDGALKPVEIQPRGSSR